MPRVSTKNVRDQPAPGDGRRVLVMTLWPRGVKKSAVDAWYKDLGTPRALIRAWKSGKITWSELRRGYGRHLRTPAAVAALGRLAALVHRERVTLLCLCRDPNRCHRTLLQKKLECLLRGAG